MMLDNILTAHSREAYKGERKVTVAMAQICKIPYIKYIDSLNNIFI